MHQCAPGDVIRTLGNYYGSFPVEMLPIAYCDELPMLAPPQLGNNGFISCRAMEYENFIFIHPWDCHWVELIQYTLWIQP